MNKSISNKKEYIIIIFLFVTLITLITALTFFVLRENQYKKIKYDINIVGEIEEVEEVLLQDAIVHQTNQDAVEEIKTHKNDYSAYRLTLTLNNKTDQNDDSIERLDWFVLPGTRCLSSPLSDFMASGNADIGDALLSVYHSETPEPLGVGKKNYSLYLILNVSKKSDAEIEAILSKLTVNVQTDVYLFNSESPTFSVMTPISK